MNYINRNPKIILIAGKARSGKNTVAEYLKKEYTKRNKQVIISPYTKYLKKYIEEITEEKITEENKHRDLLQKICSELIKDKLKKEDFYIRRQIEDIEIYSFFKDVIIIPDVRFPNEIEEIKEQFNNVISIGMIRNNFETDLTIEQQNDITETALDNYQNYYYIINNESFLKLREKVKEIVMEEERRQKDE